MIHGEEQAATTSPIEQLGTRLRGKVLQPDCTAYDQSRTVWNGSIDRRPALIVQCAGVSDIRQALEYARHHDLVVSVKGGGHNVAGNAVCDGGLMIDLALMKGIRVDPREQDGASASRLHLAGV